MKLIPVIAQDARSNDVLMLAWTNAEALRRTRKTGYMHYWSRSRGRLWKKGEESGHLQTVSELRLDCDGDVIVLQIEQAGGIACHTGRESCLYRKLVGEAWQITDPVLKDPAAIYQAGHGH